MVESATQFRKNGFNDQDAAQLAQVSTMFQNVADETISAGDSAEFLISQLIAFNQTTGDVAGNAMHIADSLNQVANSFAVGTGDLATGLKVVASSSSAMGNSLEQTIGLMTAITEQTKNASKASRGLNSIMANLAQVLDPTSSNGEKIVAIFKDLGVSMYDTNGQLKSGFDLLQGLYEKWGTLDGNTQKYIATTVAGTTQLNNFLALMNNFGHAIDATNTALDSQGSAMRENAAYMESVQAKLSQLQSTFQDFANNVIGSDLAKGILDIANVLLQLANTPLGQVVTQILLLTSLGWGASSLLKALKVFQAGALQFKALAQLAGAAGAAGGIKSLADAFALLQLSGAAALPIIAAISAAIVGLIALSKTDWFKEMFHEADYVNEKIDTLNSELETTKQKIQELKDQGASQNVIDLYTDKLASLTKQLDEFNSRKFHLAFGETETKTSYDDWGNQTTEQVNKLTESLQKLKTLEESMKTAPTVEAYNRLEEQYRNTKEALLEYYNVGSEANAQGVEFTETEKDLWYQLVDLFGTVDEVAQKKAELALSTTNNTILTAKETKALLAQANQLGVSKTKMAELSAQTIIFNNTKLDVSQKIDALRQLAVQAGVTKDMINWANKDEEYDRYMLRMTGHGMSGEEAERRYLSSLWDKWTKSLYKKVPEEEEEEPRWPSTTKAKTAVEKLTDAWKEELNVLKDRLELLQKSGASEEEQIEQMRKIQRAIHGTAEKYRALGLSEESEYLRQLGILWWDYENKIQDVYDDIEEAAKKAAEEAKQAWKESLEQQKSWYESAASVVLDKIDEEIEAREKEREAEEQKWNDRIQALKDTNAQLDDQIKKEQLLNNLAKAKQKQVYVYKDGRFQYVQDVDEIASAQAELDTYERDKQLEDEVNRLEKLKDAALDKIDKQIEGWKDYRKEWENTVKQYTKYQDKMIAQMILGTDLEQKNWQTRIKNAQEFADEYNEIMKNLADLNGETLPDSVTDKNGVTIDKYGRKTSGTSTVNPDAIMSKKDRDDLAAAGKRWNEAKTDEERKKAHDDAEAIRKKYGYSGGAAGDKYIPKNASGTLSSQGGLSLVGEKGPELRVLNSGDGVIPADITRNLWNWGKINPSTFGNKSINHVFNISNLSLPGVRDAESLVSGLKRMAYQRAYQRA